MLITQNQRKTEEIAAYRVSRGEHIAERLKTISNGSKTASAVAYRLELCTARDNTWEATDLHSTETGEAYAGTGNLFGCNSKLCPACSANQSREMRKRARKAVESLGKGNYDVRWRSVVLTMPLQRGAAILTAVEKINDAFRRMTNRKFWKSRVKGGIKSVEFTVRPDGYHVHIHLLILSEHLPVNAEMERRFSRLQARRRLYFGNLQDELAYALKAAGIALNGSPVVFVADVRNQSIKARGNREISLEKALQETAKYITKSESWDAIPDESLVEIAEISRWKRMFEILGAARRRNTAAEVENSDGESSEPSLVHTKTLFNGERLPSWREALNAMNFRDWQREMRRRINRIRAFRRSQLSEKFEFASFRLLTGEIFGVGASATT